MKTVLRIQAAYSWMVSLSLSFLNTFIAGSAYYKISQSVIVVPLDLRNITVFLALEPGESDFAPRFLFNRVFP